MLVFACRLRSLQDLDECKGLISYHPGVLLICGHDPIMMLVTEIACPWLSNYFHYIIIAALNDYSQTRSSLVFFSLQTLHLH